MIEIAIIALGSVIAFFALVALTGEGGRKACPYCGSRNTGVYHMGRKCYNCRNHYG